METTGRDLSFPRIRWTEPHAAGNRIESTEIKVPSFLIWFPAVEERAFECPSSALDRGTHHAEADVRRVKCMMAERCEDQTRRRSTMHECHRSKRRFAGGASIDDSTQAASGEKNSPYPARGSEHQNITLTPS